MVYADLFPGQMRDALLGGVLLRLRGSPGPLCSLLCFCFSTGAGGDDMFACEACDTFLLLENMAKADPVLIALFIQKAFHTEGSTD